MVYGIKQAIAATACEACGRLDPTMHARFCADRDNVRFGGTGRFRGALCGFCNSALGWHERRGWPLSPWLAEYLARAVIRPLVAHDADRQLALITKDG